MEPELDLRDVRAFCRVAENGSLTRAAAVMGVAQSALSRRIAALERALGGRLFHRTGRGALPTDLGERLLPRARNLLLEADALLGEGRGERASPAGTVELALVPAVSRPLVSLLVRRLREEFPRIRLRATEGYSGEVEAWLADGRADLGLFNRYGRGRVRDAEPVLGSDMVLVTPRGRFPARTQRLPFVALDGLPLALPPRPNSLVSSLSDLAQRHRVRLDLALEASTPAIIRDAVAHAGLCTLVPPHLAAREYAGADFQVIPLGSPALHQRTWLAFTTRHPATLATRAVARLVREIIAARLR